MKHGNKSLFKKIKGTGTIPPGSASIIDNRTNIITIKLQNLICLKKYCTQAASLQSDCPSRSEKNVTQVHLLN